MAEDDDYGDDFEDYNDDFEDDTPDAPPAPATAPPAPAPTPVPARPPKSGLSVQEAIALENQAAQANSRPPRAAVSASASPMPDRTVVGLPGTFVPDVLGTPAPKGTGSFARLRGLRDRGVTLSEAGDTSLLEMPPRPLAALFAAGEGAYSSTHVTTAVTQTRASGVAVAGSQTEEPEVAPPKGTQFPDATTASVDPSTGGGGGPGRAMDWGRGTDAGAGAGIAGSRAQRWRSFVSAVAPAVEAWLEEVVPVRGGAAPRLAGGTAVLDAAAILGPALAQRAITALSYHPLAGTGQLLVAYGPSARGEAEEGEARAAPAGVMSRADAATAVVAPPRWSKPPPLRAIAGALIVWRLGATAARPPLAMHSWPQCAPPGRSVPLAAPPTDPSVAYVLALEGSPTALAWGPPRCPHVVLAGTAEGTLALWDLREPAAAHPAGRLAPGVGAVGGDALPCGGDDQGAVTCRRPCFVTEGCPPDPGSDVAAIVALAAVEDAAGVAAGEGLTGPWAGGTESGRPFAVVSLTAWGRVDMWTVSTVTAGAVGSARDHGLRLGGRLRMVETATRLPLGRPAARGDPGGAVGGGLGPFAATELTGDPCASNLFLVGADGGRVLRGARFGRPPAPHTYPWGDGGAGAECAAPAVTCLAHSPHAGDVFLAGYADGGVSLFRAGSPRPLLSWRGFSRGGAARLRWSPARPALFYVLDSLSCLHSFDVVAAAAGGGPPGAPAVPLESKPLAAGDAPRLERARGGGWGTPDAVTMDAAPSLPPGVVGVGATLAVGHRDGRVRVHAVEGARSGGELEQMRAALDGLTA